MLELVELGAEDNGLVIEVLKAEPISLNVSERTRIAIAGAIKGTWLVGDNGTGWIRAPKVPSFAKLA
jgi:hypothetical protein